MVIAGEAGETTVVVQPLGLVAQTTLNIAHRTDVGADAAFHAACAVDMKGTVGDQPPGEGMAQYACVDAWPMPSCKGAPAISPLHNI